MNIKTRQKMNENRQESPANEFIPFACHYDSQTLLTKNGELLQTIKIVGFTFENVNRDNNEELTLRHVLRRAILESVKEPGYAIWFHTVRRQKDLTTGGKYPPGFADHVNKEWCKRHDWQHKYVNELYVTVIHEGQEYGAGFGDFVRALSFSAERSRRQKYLAEAAVRLHQTVEKIQQKLTGFGARRLGMGTRGGDTTYSEPLQFFGKILNLKEILMPVPISDISDYLATHQASFGHNAFEVKGQTGQHYGAILSIKEYHEVTSSAIDKFLQLDQQFVITETFDFVNNAMVLKQFEHQQYILKLSEDPNFGKVTGLSDIVTSNRNGPTDFGEHQITITLVEDDLGLLEKEVKRILEAFHELGIVAIREDVMLEDCYWSQLPGNFEFLRRRSPINTARLGGFASLYNFPAGRLSGNHWGNALTVFYTKAGTPYFFNFHDGDNGHTTIIGPYGAGKTVLLNFLVSEAMKYNPRLLFFDQHRASELFIRALGGSYRRIMKDRRSTQLRFNPLRLPNTPENRLFIKLWLYYLLMDENNHVPEMVRDQLPQVVDYVYSLPDNERKLSHIAEKFWPVSGGSAPEIQQVTSEESIAKLKEKIREDIDPAIAALLKETNTKIEKEIEEKKVQALALPSTPEARLALWYGDGKYACFFDNDVDELDMEKSILGFDMTDVVQEKWPRIPVLFYLLHRIKQRLDGKPTIIVLDEAWSLIDNPIFAPKISEWLEDFRKKNALVIFATESVEDASKSSITSALSQHIATQIYLPNRAATEAYQSVFGLTKKEYSMLTTMRKSRREFLLKHHDQTVVATLDLADMNDIIGIFSGSRENIALAENIMLEVGDDPLKWVPVFREKIK